MHILYMDGLGVFVGFQVVYRWMMMMDESWRFDRLFGWWNWISQKIQFLQAGKLVKKTMRGPKPVGSFKSR